MVKFLKKFANGGKVKLHQLICSSGTIFGLADKDENHIEKLYLGSTHPKNSTFIRNYCYDGKLEEVRLDKLMQVISRVLRDSISHFVGRSVGPSVGPSVGII